MIQFKLIEVLIQLLKSNLFNKLIIFFLQKYQNRPVIALYIPKRNSYNLNKNN